MAVFEWQGIDARGKDVKGIRDADNPRLLRALLRKDGILATAIEEEAAARTRTRARDRLRAVLPARLGAGRRDHHAPARDAAARRRAARRVAERADRAGRQRKLQAALTQMRDKVNEGTSFAKALEAHPKIFAPLYMNMVAAGESSGTLDTCSSASPTTWSAGAAARQGVSALAYPAFMVLIGVAVIALLMVVVVPKVTTIFEGFNATLPWYTRR